MLEHFQGKTVYLEFLKQEHFAVLKQLARDYRIWEFTKAIFINDRYDEQMDAYLSLALDKNALGGQQAFIIRDKKQDTIIGMTRIYGLEPSHKRFTIGYTWYIPAVWGQAHNKECKLLLLQYAFDILQFNRVDFYVAEKNIRSQKAVEKIGGVREGLLRNYSCRLDGSVSGAFVFSIIREEWPEKKARLQQLAVDG